MKKIFFLWVFLFSYTSIQAQENTTKEKAKNAFLIYVKADHSFEYKEKEITQKSLKAKLRTYLVNNSARSQVVVKADLKASVARILELKELIRSVVVDLKDDLAIKQFNKPYKKLTEKEKEIVEAWFPSSGLGF